MCPQAVGRPVCGAKKRDGNPCPMPPMKGGARCRKHGGKAPQTMAKAARRLAFGELIAWHEERAKTDPTMSDPHHNLLRMVQVAAVQEAAMRESVLGLRDGQDRQELGAAAGNREVDALEVERWEKARKELRESSALAIKAGIEQRQLHVAEKQAEVSIAVILAVMKRLGLSAALLAKAPVYAAEEFERLTG